MCIVWQPVSTETQHAAHDHQRSPDREKYVDQCTAHDRNHVNSIVKQGSAQTALQLPQCMLVLRRRISAVARLAVKSKEQLAQACTTHSKVPRKLLLDAAATRCCCRVLDFSMTPGTGIRRFEAIDHGTYGAAHLTTEHCIRACTTCEIAHRAMSSAWRLAHRLSALCSER